MSVDPSKHRILLVGPRVIHLKPFFERRRYNCVAVQKGVEGMTALDAEPRDIVILELNLGDLTATEFLMAARQAHAQASFLLLDDASKAGQIVKALQAGLDGYLPTPPDEDRLFFEVERHLRHAGNGNGASGGTNSGATQMTRRPEEFTLLETQLADRDSQLVEIGMQNDFLQQEIVKLRDTAKTFNSVKNALVGVLEGELDDKQAVRLKERLAMATVLETEVDTLREELSGLRTVRRELQEQVDHLKRRERELADRIDDKKDESLEGAALRDRAQELEADNMVMAGRVAELEDELDLAKAEVVALEQKQREELTDLQRALNLASSDNALTAGDVERAQIEHAAAMSRLEDQHKDDVGRLREEYEGQLKRLVSDVEIEKATVALRISDAVAKREKELNEGLAKKEKELNDALHRREKDLAGPARELQEQLEAAIIEKDQAVEKALDIELILDELNTKIEFLETEVTKAQDRAKHAEDNFKKDKLRLIEEKEVAASGSQEAFSKVQRFIDENAVLKRANSELDSTRQALEERARLGDEASANAALQLEQAAIIRAEAIQQRDTAEGAKRAADERNAQLERQVNALDEQLAEERRRVEAKDRALQEAGTAANRLADANAAKDALEREAERLGEKLADAEGRLMRLTEELDARRQTGGESEAAVTSLRERIRQVEESLQEHEAGEREGKELLTAMQNEMEAQRKALTEHYEQRLRDAVQGSPSAAQDALAERDAYRQRLAETEAWVQQAQVHLEALRVERDQLAAQATALSNDMHSRGSESQELYAQLSQAKQHIEQLTGKSAGLEQELLSARQQSAREGGSSADARELGAAHQEVRALQQQLQLVEQQVAQMQGGNRGGRLPEELEPLRWTLTAAIDAITGLEAREPALAAHLRNLRLLASTLQKLSPGT